MRNFHSGRSRRGDSSRGYSGGRDSRQTTMHDAVCDKCGKDCQVPFRPSGDKPIYCSNCFERNERRDDRRPSQGGFRKRSFEGRGSGRSPRGDRGDRNISELTDKIKQIDSKLDKIIAILSPGEKLAKPEEAKTKKKKKDKEIKTDENIDVSSLIEIPKEDKTKKAEAETTAESTPADE